MGLDLKGAPIIDKKTAAQLGSVEEILDFALNYAHNKLGVDEYDKPNTKPEDLSDVKDPEDLTNEQLALLHTQYTGWASYYNCQLATIKAAVQPDPDNN